MQSVAVAYNSPIELASMSDDISVMRIPIQGLPELIILQPAQHLSMAACNKQAAFLIQQLAPSLLQQQSALVMVTPKPFGTLGMIRKYWLRYVRRLENARASTLDLTKRQSLERSIEIMKNLPFSLGCPSVYGCGVYFIEPEDTENTITRLSN
ncbi:MAG TPA: hypothetical protein VNX65_02040 [Patescibacteria group bacterium]|jgi:hypothetical protein|nr:hypothetical protein [Patescibacteria group bacterium]